MGLQGLRDQKQSGLIIVIFVVIIFVFIFMFGLPSMDIFGGSEIQEIATVGEHRIETKLLRSMFMRYTNEDIYRSPNYAVYRDEMIDNISLIYLLADEARAAGLRVSEKEWNFYIQDWEAGNSDVLELGFLKKNEFSKQQYEYALQRIQMSSLDYRSYKENELLARKYLKVMENSITVSDEMLWSVYLEGHRTADLELVRLTPAAVKAVLPEATDAEVDNYLVGNLSEIQSYYDAHRGLYTTPEQIQIQRIVIQKDYSKLTNIGEKTIKKLAPDERYSIARRAVLTDHGDFSQAFKDYDEAEDKEDGGLQPMRALNTLPSALQKELTGKKVGDVVAVELDDMYVIAQVRDYKAEVVSPFDAEKHSIARKLLTDSRVADKTATVSSKLLSLVGIGKPLSDALEESLYDGILKVKPLAPEPVAAPAPEVAAEEGDAAATAEGEATATAEGEATATAEGEATATAEGEATATAEGEAVAAATPEPDEIAAAVVAAAPVPVDDPIVVSIYDRIVPTTISEATMYLDTIRGIGESAELVRDIRSAQEGTTLSKAYRIGEDMVIVRVVKKSDPSRESFETSEDKENLRALLTQNALYELIGDPDQIFGLNIVGYRLIRDPLMPFGYAVNPYSGELLRDAYGQPIPVSDTLRGARGIWLQQKLSQAKQNNVIRRNERYFAADNERLKKRNSQTE